MVCVKIHMLCNQFLEMLLGLDMDFSGILDFFQIEVADLHKTSFYSWPVRDYETDLI